MTDKEDDLNTLLNTPMEDIKPPPLPPSGSYRGTLINHEITQGRWDINRDDPSKGKETVARLNVRLKEAGNDLEVPEDVVIKDRLVTKDYVLSKERIKILSDTLTRDLGVKEGMSILSGLPEVHGLPVVVELKSSISKTTGNPFITVEKIFLDR